MYEISDIYVHDKDRSVESIVVKHDLKQEQDEHHAMATTEVIRVNLSLGREIIIQDNFSVDLVSDRAEICVEVFAVIHRTYDDDYAESSTV